MLSNDDINEYRSRVAEIATTSFESALTESYGRTLDATTHLKNVVDGRVPRKRGLSKAVAAMQDARVDVPAEHLEGWDEMIEALEADGE